MPGSGCREQHVGVSEIFDRVVCGVERCEAGRVAAQLASRLTRPEGSLTLVAVDDSSIAVHAGFQMAAVAAELLHEATAALDEARSIAEPTHTVETRLLEGDASRGLLAEIERQKATLAVVGSHARSRAVGIALGLVSTHLLHEAPCSVLVARPPRGGERWPRSIVVGIDGSPESAAAADVARDLGERFDAGVRFAAATGDPVDVEMARAIAPDLQELTGRAVDELHLVSEFVDLVVVGSRGLRGLRALGSISERVAHEALCSVLVVRPGREKRS